MILKSRKEAIRENKLLLIKVLEHIINVTNLGLSLKENKHHLILSYPPQSYYHYDSGSAIAVRKAQLIFSLSSNSGLKVRHRVGCNDDNILGEIAAEFPPGIIDEKLIYEHVINFLQIVKNR